VRRRVPAIVALVTVAIILLAGTSIVLYHHALADFFDVGPGCGGG
jgi:hypothetical protein